MNLSDFDYVLPEELIAQQPLADRTASRLLVLDRAAGQVTHRRFTDLADLLMAGDLLVRNETRVIPARLQGHKASGGKIEVLLVRQLADENQLWRCMTRSSKPVRCGARLYFPGDITGRVEAEEADGCRLIRFECGGSFFAALEQFGQMPLPPYIRRAAERSDHERYQTVFAGPPGSVAAPTAGLHFDQATFARLAARGVETCGLTLHVGLGTFLPVRSENLAEHRMHGELYDIPVATAAKINQARHEGRRIIALGTTTTRTLEDAVDDDGRLRAGPGMSELFIWPGFQFQIVDGLITNFHLPKSTLLMLVSAFAGREQVLAAYRQAVEQNYRFFSYGDCMLIV